MPSWEILIFQKVTQKTRILQIAELIEAPLDEKRSAYQETGLRLLDHIMKCTHVLWAWNRKSLNESIVHGVLKNCIKSLRSLILGS
jgi:hypothetical protein